jgi:hypothetical protein
VVQDNQTHVVDEHGELSFSRRTALTLLGLGAFSGVASSDVRARTGKSPVSSPGGSDNPVFRTDEFSAFIDEVLPGDKFGKLRVGPYEQTLQMSGTRESSWMVKPLHCDEPVNSDSYKQISSVGYGVVPFPPGKVPVLRITGHLNGGPNATTSLRLSIANREGYSPPGVDGIRYLEDDPVRQTLLEVTAEGETQVFDEVYLSDIEDVVTGLDNAHPLPSHTLLLEAKTDAPAGNATVGEATTVSLELEAL